MGLLSNIFGRSRHSQRQADTSDLVAYLPYQSSCHMYALVNVSTAVELFGTPICGWCNQPCGIRAHRLPQRLAETQATSDAHKNATNQPKQQGLDRSK